MKHDLNDLLMYVKVDEFMYRIFMFYLWINQLLNFSLEGGMIMNRYMYLMVVNIISQSSMDNKDTPFITNQQLTVLWLPNLTN